MERWTAAFVYLGPLSFFLVWCLKRRGRRHPYESLKIQEVLAFYPQVPTKPGHYFFALLKHGVLEARRDRWQRFAPFESLRSFHLSENEDGFSLSLRTDTGETFAIAQQGNLMGPNRESYRNFIMQLHVAILPFAERVAFEKGIYLGKRLTVIVLGLGIAGALYIVMDTLQMSRSALSAGNLIFPIFCIFTCLLPGAWLHFRNKITPYDPHDILNSFARGKIADHKGIDPK